MITVPEDIPVTIPLDAPTLASEGSPLVHMPPGNASLSVTDAPTHTFVGPVMATGAAITVTVVVVAQPPTV
jgi:hypothetical protein